MAYREFHNEKYYEAPDISILTEGLNKAADNIGAMFRAIGDAQVAKKKNADQYKFDLGEGKFENDDKIFFQKGLNITERGKNDIKSYGRLSPELEKDQNISMQEKNQSDWQYKKFENNEKEILTREKEDKYYDPQPDREGNKLAAYGENNDIYYGTRGERLEAFDKVKGKLPQSLRGKIYTSDYVKAFGAKENTKATGSPTSKSSVYSKTPFLNEQGVPGITIDHAKEYLSSRPDGSVARWIEHQVDQAMDADVKYNKQRNPQLKDMSDEEVKLYLKANPKENQYNKKDFATRVIEKAQSEMAEAADIAQKTDYETKVDKSITGGTHNNDTIGHSYTEHRDAALEGKSGVGFKGEFGGIPTDKPSENVMPGGNLLIGKGAKIGQPIPVTLNPRRMYNIRTGENQEVKGSTDVNLTGYQLQLYDKNGKVVNIDANNLDQIPPSKLKDMELKIALRGFTVEYGNKLGEIASKKSQLDDELADAVANGDLEKQAAIERNMMNLDRLKGSMQMSKSEFSDADLLSAFKQNGIPISSVRRDVILEASEADKNIINKNITQGLNLDDESKWSDQMRSFKQKFEQRKSQPDAPAPKTKPAAKKSAPVPSGNVLVTSPDGKKGYIPASQLDAAIQAGYKKAE